MTFWDVGAHIGFFSLLAGRLVGESGQVHSFEPLEENRRRLQDGLQKNNCKNITVHDVALAAVSGKATFHAHGSSLMWTLVAERGKEEGIKVRCCTLDETMQSATTFPDLIKIDTEGAEVDVLRGGVQLFSTAGPALLVEFSNAALLMQARGLLPYYTFERLAGQHWLLRKTS
jgi:FkbM family methyltransferase